MTGIYSITTPQKCEHYARFMRDVQRGQADAIFWTCFVFMIFLLVVASTMHAKASQTLFDPEKKSQDVNLHNHVRRRCLLASLICFILALGAVIIEAFAAFNIQFCDGEDLMMLYWGFWTLVQVGSLIAIFGIMLNQWYSLREKEHPPWNVALGTPVLVIAALGHAWESCVRAAWRKWTGKVEDDKSTWSTDGVSMNRTPTIPPHPDARHIGFSLTNEPLFAYPTHDTVTQTRGLLQATAEEMVSQRNPLAKTEVPASLVQFESVQQDNVD